MWFSRGNLPKKALIWVCELCGRLPQNFMVSWLVHRCLSWALSFCRGAPYYAGMAALRVGAELLYLCTAEEATGGESHGGWVGQQLDGGVIPKNDMIWFSLRKVHILKNIDPLFWSYSDEPVHLGFVRDYDCFCIAPGTSWNDFYNKLHWRKFCCQSLRGIIPGLVSAVNSHG